MALVAATVRISGPDLCPGYGSLREARRSSTTAYHIPSPLGRGKMCTTLPPVLVTVLGIVLHGDPHLQAADARVLYRVLAAIGGREIVGPAPELDPGTFYRAISGD